MLISLENEEQYLVFHVSFLTFSFFFFLDDLFR